MSPLRSTVTLPAVVVGLATFLVVLIPGTGLPVAVVAGVIVASTFARVVSGRAVGVVRRSLNARPALVGEFPRLHNTVGGLCLTHGIDIPELFVIDSPEGNAAAMAGREGTSMVLTTGAADRLGLVDERGRVFTLSGARPKSVTTEEQGPEKVVVAVAGDYADAEGKTYMSYVTRLTFRNGSPRVTVAHTHVNTYVKTEFTDITSLSMPMRLKIMESSLIRAMFRSRWVFSITFAASAVWMDLAT